MRVPERRRRGYYLDLDACLLGDFPDHRLDGVLVLLDVPARRQPEPEAVPVQRRAPLVRDETRHGEVPLEYGVLHGWRA